jgi:hypothetical protein
MKPRHIANGDAACRRCGGLGLFEEHQMEKMTMKSCSCLPSSDPDQSNTGWLILFHGSDTKEAEWEWVNGDRDFAVEYATCDRRHTNYGRTGYTLHACATKPERDAL